MSLTAYNAGAQIQDAQIKPKHVPKLRFKIWRKKKWIACMIKKFKTTTGIISARSEYPEADSFILVIISFYAPGPQNISVAPLHM
jgi:hypothetical protein